MVGGIRTRPTAVRRPITSGLAECSAPAKRSATPETSRVHVAKHFEPCAPVGLHGFRKARAQFERATVGQHDEKRLRVHGVLLTHVLLDIHRSSVERLPNVERDSLRKSFWGLIGNSGAGLRHHPDEQHALDDQQDSQAGDEASGNAPIETAVPGQRLVGFLDGILLRRDGVTCRTTPKSPSFHSSSSS